MSDEPISDVPEEAPALSGTPVLPLRDVVVYPHMVIPLFVGREKSIVALDLAMKADKRILLVAQKQADVDDPKADDLYRVGTIATILQLLKLPDGTVKVLVEGVDRASIDKLTEGEFFSAEVTPLPDLERYEEREMDVLTRSVITQFEQYVKLNKKVPPEILTSLAGIEQAGRLADTVAAHMSLKLSEKQKVLEIPDVRKRLEHMLAVIEGEMDVLQIEKRIRGRVKQQMEKSQREYYLNEQMKAIQKELGDLDDAPNEIGELEKRITTAWKRSRSGSSSIWPCSSGSRTCAAPFCAWLGRRVSARPRSARAWRAPRTASSCACRWAACAMRRRFVATGAPTSAPCRARSFRISQSAGFEIHCSCWMKSTRCRRIFAAIRPRPCSRCSIRNRTAPSTTIISKWISISRK